MKISLKKSCDRGDTTKGDLFKMAKQIGVNHPKKISKGDLYTAVHKGLQKIGKVSQWDNLNQKGGNNNDFDIGKCSLRMSAEKGLIGKNELFLIANKLGIEYPKKISKGQLCTIVHSNLSKMGKLSQWQEFLQGEVVSKKMVKKKQNEEKPPRSEKFSTSKCKRGDLLEYSLENVRDLAKNMNIPIYRKSARTGNDVYTPKKELCTAIKNKFNTHYADNEKFNWQLIRDGNIRPMRKDDSDNFSDVMEQVRVVHKRSPVKKPHVPKKIKFKDIPIGNDQIIQRGSLSTVNSINSDMDKLEKLKIAATKYGISHQHSNGVERTADELDYYIKQKYNEINKILKSIY